MSFPTLRLFGIDFACVDLREAVDTILARAAGREKCLVVTPNVDQVITIHQRPDVRRIYENTDMIFADGMPIVWLSKLLPGRSLPARVTGADMFPEICAQCAQRGLSIAFIGGLPGVAEEAARQLQARYPGLRVVGTYSPPFGFENDEAECARMVALCAGWRPDVLCLGLGAPKQELWGARHLDALDCGPVLCFGAVLDFAAGKVERAPAALREAGFEWLWRLLQEPGRMWRRYLVRGPLYFWYALAEASGQWSDFLGNNVAGDTNMKNIFKKLAGLLDPVVAFLSVFAGAFFKAVRMYGLHRLPLTRALLKRLGVMPITSHYYDPMFSEKDQRFPLDKPRALPGIDLNESGQAGFLASLVDGKEFCEVALAPGSGFVFPNGTFETGDAEFWYAVVRTVKPRRIIEIGCGQSTRIAVMAIASNKKEDPSYNCEMTCIEPYEMPWLEQLGIRVIRERVELLDRSIFSSLQAGDILFIDSSHMIRPQGDVLHEFLEILPSLPSGVYVHVHDIFTPRDYPAAWLLDHMRFWNEQYLLEAFLTENSRWEIIAGVNYLKHAQFDALRRVCPMMEANREPGSFYMRKK